MKKLFLLSLFITSFLFFSCNITFAADTKDPKGDYPVELSLYRIYEAYRNNAQYKKALEILQKLIKEEPTNSDYYIELGSLYLHCFVDLNKAVVSFEKASELNPANAHAYILLGEIYEKRNDYKKAHTMFSKAIGLKPSLDAFAWAKNNIKALNLIRKRQLIKDWWFIGPFDNTNDKGYKRVYPPEKEIDLDAVYVGKNNYRLSWKRVYEPSMFGFIDFNIIFPIKDNTVCYVLNYVYSQKERQIQMMMGSDDGIKLWLNDENIFSLNIGRRALVDDNIVYAHLKKGWNKILIKVSQTWGGWGLYFRITNMKGKPIPDLVFDPDKNIEVVKKSLARYRTKQFLTILGVSFIIVSVILFLFIIIKIMIEQYEVKRLKEDFISSVSHEMKTPITSIKMFTETLLMGRLRNPEKKNDYFNRILTQADRLTDYIDNILDFSRLESGQMIYDFREHPVYDTLSEIADSFKQHHPDVELQLNIDSKLKNKNFVIDRNSFDRALLNIMFNAVKYSEKKPVILDAVLFTKKVRISVIDQGIGIDKKEIKKIFTKFYRTKTSSMSKIKGTGLGLTIVKRIIKTHNGTISVKSVLGKGSTFTIILNVI